MLFYKKKIDEKGKVIYYIQLIHYLKKWKFSTELIKTTLQPLDINTVQKNWRKESNDPHSHKE